MAIGPPPAEKPVAGEMAAPTAFHSATVPLLASVIKRCPACIDRKGTDRAGRRDTARSAVVQRDRPVQREPILRHGRQGRLEGRAGTRQAQTPAQCRPCRSLDARDVEGRLQRVGRAGRIPYIPRGHVRLGEQGPQALPPPSTPRVVAVQAFRTSARVLSPHTDRPVACGSQEPHLAGGNIDQIVRRGKRIRQAGKIPAARAR